MKLWILAALISLMTIPLRAEEPQPKELRVCIEDKAIFNLYNKPGTESSKLPGILIDFFHHMEKKIGFTVKFVRRPATACKILMKSGEVDAYGLISYSVERTEWGQYPEDQPGQINRRLAFNRAGYFLYSRADQLLPWDGKALESLRGKRIGGSEGYSILDELKKAGITVEPFKSLDAMIKRLNAHQVDGIALHSNRVDQRLSKEGLKKYDIPLRMNDYFITFSKPFFQAHSGFCRQFWKDTASYEESGPGKRRV